MAVETKHWNRVDSVKPTAGQLVDWIAPDGREIHGGKFHGGRIWFLPPEHDCYIYYTPEFWRPAFTQGGESR